MKSAYQIFSVLVLTSLFSFQALGQTNKYKCLLQMSNYMGEGAYIVVSLIKPDGTYEKTLSVMGNDAKWYNSLVEWHKFQSKKPTNIDAITGPTVTGGNRSIKTFEIEDAKMDKGYKLRFETAVEKQKYYSDDVEIPLTTAGIADKVEGKGYIRYVKLSKIQ